MSGLVLNLKPHEAFMINGARVENGQRKAVLRIVSADTKVLRLRNAMRPEQATTVLKQAYYVSQLAVAGALEPDAAAQLLRPAIKELKDRSSLECRPKFQAISAHIKTGDFYAVMRELSDLMEPRNPREPLGDKF